MATRYPLPEIARATRTGSRGRLRSWSPILVFPAGVFAVHQFAYVFAYGASAGTELSAHGDHYVATAAVVAVALVAIALGVGLLRLVAARRGRSRPPTASIPIWLVWLGATLALVAGFCALEGLEIVFEAHHVGGVVGIVGAGGLWALPAAMLVGALITLAMRGGRALLVLVARRRSTGPASSGLPHPRGFAGVPARRPMRGCAAERAPPIAEPA